MDSALGWAMVGTGWHVRDRAAPAAQRAAGTRLAAVCSRDPMRAEHYRRTFEFERAYTSYADLLIDDNVDVVYLATPNHLHAEQTIQAARAGKHVLVEKPMALSAIDARAMLDACDAGGVKLGVGFHLRHHPAHQKARQLLAEGQLGQPLLVQLQWVRSNVRREGWWQDPAQVGAYITMARGVHLLDLLCYLTGRPPHQVLAMTDGQREGRSLEETALALVRFDGDLFGSIVASRTFVQVDNSLAIYGSDGSLRTTATIGTDAEGVLELTIAHETRRISYRDCDPYQIEIEAFNRSVLEDVEPDASGRDGLRSVTLTEALLKSARSGQAVDISEAGPD
jgi:1,5-anhydro-D-fructose reductase (1,5-anhydro-D-mannitol-forming)